MALTLCIKLVGDTEANKYGAAYRGLYDSKDILKDEFISVKEKLVEYIADADFVCYLYDDEKSKAKEADKPHGSRPKVKNGAKPSKIVGYQQATDRTKG